jgi:metal-responsive CopG/Arc/MetJ family transcriptional regulator
MQVREAHPMVRKNVFLPQDLIRQTESMAAREGTSFAEMVRRALVRYEPEQDDEAMLNALIERVLQTHRETIALLDRVEAQMDETHARIEAHRHGDQ